MPADLPAVPPDAIETLIQRCLQGDQTAWDAIVRQYWRKVFNVAYKFVGKHDEAEDLTQDIFLKIFKSLDTFDRRANFQTWLISVSRNLCIDHYRSVRKERETIDRDVDASELAPASPDAGADGGARAARPRGASARRRSPRPARHAAHGGAAARHPGAVVPGNRRSAAAAGRHRQVAHQPRPDRAGAPGPEAAQRELSQRAGPPDARLREPYG